MMFEALLSLNFMLAILAFCFLVIMSVNIIAWLGHFFLGVYIKVKKL